MHQFSLCNKNSTRNPNKEGLEEHFSDVQPYEVFFLQQETKVCHKLYCDIRVKLFRLSHPSCKLPHSFKHPALVCL